MRGLLFDGSFPATKPVSRSSEHRGGLASRRPRGHSAPSFGSAMPESFKAPKGARPPFEKSHAFSKPDAAAAAAASSLGAGSVSETSAAQLLLKSLSVRLKETYRKTNPERPVGCDAAPRRVLTQPAFPVANG